MNILDKQPLESAVKQESQPSDSRPARSRDLEQSSTARLSSPNAPNAPPDWATLLQRTERFAAREIADYCWREVSGGILPGGYDASSVAAEAYVEVLQSREQAALSPLSEDGAIMPPADLPDLQKELKKAARRIINRLHHRKENRIMHNEAELDRLETVDGETVGVLEAFPAQEPQPDEVLMLKEETADFEQFKTRVHQFLGKERLLRQVFACHCAEISKPKEIARKLKIPVRAIQTLQKRLERRMKEFLSLKTSGRSKI